MKRRARMQSRRGSSDGRAPVPLTPRQRARIAMLMLAPGERFRMAAPHLAMRPRITQRTREGR